MSFFFELLSSKIGFSRIGRISLSKERKIYFNTPNIIIPIKNTLMKQINFIQEFERHDLFQISKEIFLKIGFLREKFKDTGFIFSNIGTLDKFKELLDQNLDVFLKDNIIPIIPFNIPTTSLSKDFAECEIKNHLIKVEKVFCKYPDFNYGLSIKIFEYSELLDIYISFIKKHKNIKILNLVDVFDNLSNYRGILNTIIKIKKELDNNLVIMVSGRIIPKMYPLMIYLGVDLIDTSYLLYLSAENFYDTIEYLLPIYKIKYLPCSCVACKGELENLIDKKYSSKKIDLLCLHNLISANNYMNKIKQYLNYEDFRAFIEKSTLDDTNLISILKVLDRDYFDLIRYETPIVQKNKEVRCLGPSSYYRPDFQEFRERMVKNFKPESWTSLIILLPCSAKKPYSLSKSHKLFHSILRKFSDFPNFQEIVLTSPLGAVPRQLENIYPVNSYDISVTGDWNTEEIKISADTLIKILEKYDKNIPILCHLEKGYKKIAQRAELSLPHKFVFSEIYGKPTSKESLESLEQLIIKYKNKFTPKEGIYQESYITKTWIRKFIKILDYQFGLDSGIKVISNQLRPIKIESDGKINLIDLENNEKLGYFSFSTGQICLSIIGFSRLIKRPFSISSNLIVFDGIKVIGNTLFRKGLFEFGFELIPNSYVAITDIEKKEIIGIGRLIVGSNFMQNSKSGRIAKIIQKR